MIQQKRKLDFKTILPFFCLFALVTLFFACIPYYVSDDANILRGLENATSLQLAIQFWHSISSRVIMEMLSFHLIKLPFALWGMLNAFIYIILAYSVSYLAGTHRQADMNALACCLVLIYPITNMLSAGWVMTSHEYLWVVALGLFSFTPWKKQLLGQKPGRVHMGLSLLALLYATNKEQFAAIVLGGLVLTIIYMFVTKKHFGLYNALWVVTALFGLVVHLVSPGINRRLGLYESYTYNSESIGLLIRIHDRIVYASRYFLLETNPAMLLCSGMLLALVWFKYKSKINVAIAGALSVLLLTMGPLSPIAIHIFPGLGRLRAAELDYFTLITAPGYYFPFILYCMMWAALFATILIAFGGKPKAILMAIILAAGFLSQMLMLAVIDSQASSTRTFIFCDFALLFIAFCAVDDLLKLENPRLTKLIKGVLYTFASFSVLGMFLSI